ncbi:MAG: sodium:proton antiporter [Alistipes sp.]|nr:sodium:proton antiporter [Candidatus Minthomonas equi]
MKKPGLALSITLIVILVSLLSLCVIIFGDEVSSGPAQTTLLLVSVIISLIAMLHLKVPWSSIEEAIGYNLYKTGPTMLILLAIGALTATWMLSGIVPTMICYGLKIISPRIFIAITFVLCCLVSTLAGSSWTTIGTIGVAMLTAGKIVGMPMGWMAGAIISGAYLGDKLSPLSDTVNLAASIAGSNLYIHVKYSLYTAIPAFVMCLAVFLIVGMVHPAASSIDMATQSEALQSIFYISPWLLLIPVVTIFMVVKKIPAFITLFISALFAGIVSFLVQDEIISIICGESRGFGVFLQSIFRMMSSPVFISTGNSLVDHLASTSGMYGMVNTIWLIICIMTTGGILSASGILDTITEKLVSVIKSSTSLVVTTICTCIVSNMVLADQYMAILLPGNMFSDTYKKMGYAPEVLSRAIGDSATVSSVLVPWNTCAVAQSTVLGIATVDYFPYSIFCFITPLISIALVAFNVNIHRIENRQMM